MCPGVCVRERDEKNRKREEWGEGWWFRDGLRIPAIAVVFVYTPKNDYICILNLFLVLNLLFVLV